MRISDWSSDVCSSDLLDTYKATNAALAGERKRIERLFVQKAALQKRTLAEQRRMSRRVDDLARQAEDLRGLLGMVKRRVGKEWASTCRSVWWRVRKKKQR